MPRPASCSRVEFLVEEPAFERVVLFYKPSLERLGIAVTVRTVDTAQYENRLRQWDFDIIIASWGKSLSPGNEQRGFWGSQAADQPGSRNVVGIKNPAVDALIERVIFAKDRDDLVAATRALDRVLLWNYYVVPQWTYGKVRTRALGPLRPARRPCRNTAFGVPDRSGGGTRTRRPRCRSGRDDALTRRLALGVRRRGRRRRRFAGAGRRAGRRAPRHVGLRRPRISGGLPAFPLRQSGRAERRRVFGDRSEPQLNESFLHLQFAQRLHPKGEGA